MTSNSDSILEYLKHYFPLELATEKSINYGFGEENIHITLNDFIKHNGQLLSDSELETIQDFKVYFKKICQLVDRVSLLKQQERDYNKKEKTTSSNNDKNADTDSWGDLDHDLDNDFWTEMDIDESKNADTDSWGYLDHDLDHDF